MRHKKGPPRVMYEQSCCVYVDAAYLYAAAARRVTGTSLQSNVTINHEALINAVKAHAASSSTGLRLLRMHWYDTAENAIPTEEHRSLAILPRVKLHLGRIGLDGNQRGISIRMGLDLVLRTPQHVHTIYLLSDETALVDFVDEAQARGFQVVLLAVANRDGRRDSLSRDLIAAADDFELLDSALLDMAVTVRQQALAPGSEAEPAAEAQEEAEPEPVDTQVPSPAVVARRAQYRPALDNAAPVNNRPILPAPENTFTQPSPGHADDTFSAEHGFSDEELTTIMDRVIDRVLDNLGGQVLTQPAPAYGGHRVIPQEIDAALLTDLSHGLGVLGLSDELRHGLRERFWQAVELREH